MPNVAFLRIKKINVTPFPQNYGHLGTTLSLSSIPHPTYCNNISLTYETVLLILPPTRGDAYSNIKKIMDVSFIW